MNFNKIDSRYLRTLTPVQIGKIAKMFEDRTVPWNWQFREAKHYGIIKVHYGFINDANSEDSIKNSEYGVSPRYIIEMPRLVWSERLSKFDDMFNCTPDGFTGDNDVEVSLSLPSHFIYPEWYVKVMCKAIECIGGTIGEVRHNGDDKSYEIDIWHENNAIALSVR